MKIANENIKETKELDEYSKEELVDECKMLRNQVQELNEKMNWMMGQIRLDKQKQFGSSSEKTDHEQMSLFFNEAEGAADLKAKEPEFEEITFKRKKHKGKREEDLAGLPTEVIEYKLPEEKQECPECSEKLHVMSKEVRRELVIIPAQLKVVEHVKYIYSCRNCEKNNISVPILKAQAPEPVIKGSVASASLVAGIMNNKYVNALPLNRQEQELDRYGISISKQNMANWMIYCSKNWLEPLYEAMKKVLQSQDVLFADETTVQVLKEPGRKAETNSYMWLYRTGAEAPPVVLYEYQTTRSSSHPKRFLNGFKGFLHCDGYQGYHNLSSDITIVGCLAHARRKFDECLKSLSKVEQVGSKAWEGLEFCNLLFEVESKLSESEAEERYQKRLELSKPILDAFLTWLKKMELIIAPKSALGKAVFYTIEQWKYIKNYLLDGRLEISNNRSERSIRPFVIGRGNWMFCNTPKGANASAVIYSILETAKENNLKPINYLTYIFEKMPNINFKDNPEFLNDLLPWSNKLPEDCKQQKKDSQSSAQ